MLGLTCVRQITPERQCTLHASRGGSSDHKCMQQIYDNSTREPLIISKLTQWEALQIELINYFSAKSSSLPPTLRLTSLHFYILVLPGINPWQCWPFMYKPIEKEAQYRGRGHILCMIFSSQRAGWISRCDSIKRSAIEKYLPDVIMWLGGPSETWCGTWNYGKDVPNQTWTYRNYIREEGP